MDGSLGSPGGRSSGTGLIGRHVELGEIDRFLDRSTSSLHGLLLSGQAGIGKTTLWKAALNRARGRGFRVLACRPTEVETQLSFSALVDLFGRMADELLPQLPEPQRVALDAALLRATTDAAPAPLGISLGVLSMVRAAADRGPVLIAVDDVPWLDDSSARALEFAFRRLEDSPVGLIAAQRTEAAPTRIPDLFASIPPERRSAVWVAPLSVDETATIVQRALDLELRRPTVVRVHELSGGNALYALELARAIQRRAGSGEPDQVAIPDSLEELIHDRIESLPQASLEVALHAAALSAPTRDVLAAAVGEEAVRAGLQDAIAARVLDIEGPAIRFSHPLIAAAIYGRAAADRRRAAHRTLAAVVREPEERARHLALAADRPDGEIAAALEEAAGSARGRGAAAAAAELAEAAVRLTPAHQADDRRRRTMAAAQHHRAAGDVPRARATLEQLAAGTPESERALILVELGHVLMTMSDRPAAGLAFRQALKLVGDDLALKVRIEWGLAGVAFLTWTDWPTGADHIAAALRAAEELGDPVLLLPVIGHFATWEFLLGRGVPRGLIERAARLERWRDAVPVIEHPDNQMAPVLSLVGEYDAASRLLHRLLADAERRGEWYALPWLYSRLAAVEVSAGEWGAAEKHVDDCKASAGQSGQDVALGYVGHSEVMLHALRGEVAECRTSADHYLRLSDRMGLAGVARGVHTSVALLELSLGDAAAALAHLEPAVGQDFPGKFEPAMLRPTVPLTVEALIGLGRLAEADELLESYEALARRLDRTISIADSLHCRALLLAARVDLEPAIAAGEEGLRLFESMRLPFETARTLLALGDVRRRARQKAAAREAIGRALAIFERLGAERWADRARAELGRTEARRTPGAELTETEQRVTELAAAGRTNREIADALFMSVHTVEAHLTRIYRTLGVRSRTDLSRRTFDRREP